MASRRSVGARGGLPERPSRALRITPHLISPLFGVTEAGMIVGFTFWLQRANIRVTTRNLNGSGFVCTFWNLILVNT